MNKERKPIGTLGKITMVYIGVLSLILVVVNVLERMGYVLIQNYLNIVGVLLLTLSLIVVLLVWLIRKIPSRVVKCVVGFLAAMVVMLAGTAVLDQVSTYVTLLLPSEYSVLQSPNGTQAVILRGVDTGYDLSDAANTEESLQQTMDRMEQRKAYILENHPEEADTLESEDDYPVGAYGYYFIAYPRVAGIFYNTNAETEGRVYLGAQSAAKLNYEWQENGDLRLYLNDAEVGDSGEVIVHF